MALSGWENEHQFISFLLICRLGISYPELSQMQARAIFQAATAMANQGIKVIPEIMVPLVGTPQVTMHCCMRVSNQNAL